LVIFGLRKGATMKLAFWIFQLSILSGLLYFLGSSARAESTQKSDEKIRMEIEGAPKLKFFGLCVSEDGAQKKRIEGVLPAEVDIDYKLHKCQVSSEDSKTNLGIRLFHNRKLVFEKKDIPPTAGIEFVIPLSGRK